MPERALKIVVPHEGAQGRGSGTPVAAGGGVKCTRDSARRGRGLQKLAEHGRVDFRRVIGDQPLTDEIRRQIIRDLLLYRVGNGCNELQSGGRDKLPGDFSCGPQDRERRRARKVGRE